MQDVVPIEESPGKSYGQILKSTAILGASSVINISLRIIRTKFLAILLGPLGIGLLGIFNSITEMVSTVAGLGIDSSGVKQIAETASTGDKEKLARTVNIIRRVSIILGLLGMTFLIVASSYICRITFENTEYTLSIACLSIIILLNTVMNGEVALIQGLRKITDLAKINILSAIFGTILSVPIIYVWGKQGIVPILIVASIMSLLSTRWFSTKIIISRVTMCWTEISTEAKPLVKLGSALMASALMSKGTMYMLYVIIARRLGLEAVGLYQAAMILSSIYVGFILESMIKDYLPRLTAIADDRVACNQLINQQTEVGILLSMPGILATLTFAPLIIQLAYTAKFIAAFEIIRWQILGILLQVVCWPMGFIMQAKGIGHLLFWTEFIKNAIHFVLIWVGISYFGLNGTGIAFFGMCLCHLIIISSVTKRLTGFTWSAANIRIVLVILPAIIIVFSSRYYLPVFWGLILGSTISVAVSFYSLKCLVSIISDDTESKFLAKIKNRLAGGLFGRNLKK